jgi:hypothetical protein
MKTTFSLVYFDCNKNVSDLLSATNGPFLFNSKEAAQERLADHVRNRIAEEYPDTIGMYAQSCGVDLFGFTEDRHDPISPAEVYYCLIEQKDFFNVKCLVDWYKKTTDSEGLYFEYKIEETPTTSFVELLCQADAIEIDGVFISSFDIVPIAKLAESSGFIMEACLDNDPVSPHRYRIVYHEAQEATYDVQEKRWRVGSLDVRLITFA